MYPHGRSLVKKYGKQKKKFGQKERKERLVVLGVNSDDHPATVLELKESGTVTWDSFFDGGLIGGPIASQWGVRGWPTIFLIDHHGVIRAKDLRGKELDSKVLELTLDVLLEGLEEIKPPPKLDIKEPPIPPIR